MDKVIETKYGRLSGVEGEHAVVFKGVPYAKPPVGELRWQAPQKPASWEGVYRADTWPAMAPQGSQEEGSFYQKEFYACPDYLPEQSEDCLYLNLWIPKNGEGPFPVAVWYHGGAYVGGFCSEMEFDGEAYAKRGIILVTVGYRLGLLGFMAHPKLRKRDGHSGNYGLLDQIAAIDWVRENIGDFNGNPDCITIMGQSAGAMSVRTLVSSPLVRGKVHRAVIQSGGGYKSPLPVNTIDIQVLEQAVDAALTKRSLTLQGLYKKPAGEIVMLQTELWKEIAEATGCMVPFCPQTDGYSLRKNCDQVLEEGELPQIPYLIGCNQNDFAAGTPEYSASPLHLSNVGFCEMQKGNPQTYLYFFQRQMPGDQAGAFHSAELWYMFGTLKRCWRPLTEADGRLSEEMLDAWADFIRTGNPGWEAYSTEKPVVRIFDVTQ